MLSKLFLAIDLIVLQIWNEAIVLYGIWLHDQFL